MTRDSHALDVLSQRAFDLFIARGQVLVTAESCTAGLIAATLARVPGMSQVLAGGFVVYQIDSKITWLSIGQQMIERHGVVSREVAEAMAVAALERTPHATIAVSITGHLGPDAPVELDGLAWMGFVSRAAQVESWRLELRSSTADNLSGSLSAEQRGAQIRQDRQVDAVRQVLEFLCAKLECKP